MKELKKLIDVKSITTLSLLFTLEIITIIVFVRNNADLITLVFTLFSNLITMVFTYLFKKNKKVDNKEGE